MPGVGPGCRGISGYGAWWQSPGFVLFEAQQRDSSPSLDTASFNNLQHLLRQYLQLTWRHSEVFMPRCIN
jgi:hypothetical protein